MKFLLIVLVIHLVIEWISGKKNTNKVQENGTMNEKVHHPAEYELR